MPEENSWSTSNQIADALQKSGSAVRGYISEFKSILEPHRKRRGKGFVYNNEAVDMLFEISNLKDQEIPTEEIKMRLLGEEQDDNTKALARPGVDNVATQQITELTTAFIGFIGEYKRTNDLLERRLNLIEKQVGLELPEPTTQEQETKETPKKKESKLKKKTKKTTKKKKSKKKTGEWTKEDMDKLRKLNGQSLTKMAKELNRTKASVKGKIASYNKRKNFWQGSISYK